MKILKSQLAKIIKEEVESVLSESWADMLAATKEIEADKASAADAAAADELVKDMKDLMSPDSTDERSFIKWQEKYHKGDKHTRKIHQILGSDEGRKVAKEIARWVGNVIKFKKTGGQEGHQYTEEPWFARYMKTLDKWIELPAKDLRNHVAWITADYVTDLIFGRDRQGASMALSGYVNPEDAGISAYGEED